MTLDDPSALRAGVRDVRAAARAVQELRRAEGHLNRRRQATSRLGTTDRAAVRFIIERTNAEHRVAPIDVAKFLEISTASVTALIDRLEHARLVLVHRDPIDRRRKILEPFDPSGDADLTDPLTGRIRAIADELSPTDEVIVTAFLRRITDAIYDESRP